MKKIFLALLLSCSLLWGIEIGGMEFSPEAGIMVAKGKDSSDKKHPSLAGYGRIWLGLADVLLAPQFKYIAQYDRHADETITQIQYGVSLGYNIHLGILRLTPFVGMNSSSFKEYYKDAYAYNAGFKIKPFVIPLSLGFEYNYQKPTLIQSNKKQSMKNAYVFLGLHF